MVLQNLTVVNLGTIKCFSYNFADGLNVLRSRHTDEIIYALRSVLNHKYILPLPQNAVRADTKIEATLSIEKTQHKIVAIPDTVKGCIMLQAYDKQGNNTTNEYLYMTDHCAEQDLADVFEGTNRDMPLRFLQYINEELYFSCNDLNRRTAGVSHLKTFRAYLRHFHRHFQPELIRNGKQYEIVLETDGRYSVRQRGHRDMPVYLSESEQILFRYLCFLRTAEFWRGFEKMRNLHSINKPLIITDFLERIDESIDTKDIMDRTVNLKQQVIVLEQMYSLTL